MGKIVLARIDDRLIHGQVMTTWVQYTGANHIVIIDDVSAADDFSKSIMEMAVPKGIGLDVVRIEEAKETIDRLDETKKIILLAKTPETFLLAFNNGVPIKKIIIGGMGANRNRKKFYKNISASEEERNTFKVILSKNVAVSIHIMPDDKEKNIDNLV